MPNGPGAFDPQRRALVSTWVAHPLLHLAAVRADESLSAPRVVVGSGRHLWRGAGPGLLARFVSARVSGTRHRRFLCERKRLDTPRTGRHASYRLTLLASIRHVRVETELAQRLHENETTPGHGDLG